MLKLNPKIGGRFITPLPLALIISLILYKLCLEPHIAKNQRVNVFLFVEGMLVVLWFLYGVSGCST